MGEIRVRIAGADREARRFASAAALLPSDVREARQEIGKRAAIIFAAHAPNKSGRLERGITARPGGGGTFVTASARDPETGFDYVGVTRFGRGIAKPKSDDGALSFTGSGGLVYAASADAYDPPSDWAAEALPEVNQEAQQVTTKLARRIEARL